VDLTIEKINKEKECLIHKYKKAADLLEEKQKRV
jgi:hypothetical protein